MRMNSTDFRMVTKLAGNRQRQLGKTPIACCHFSLSVDRIYHQFSDKISKILLR